MQNPVADPFGIVGQVLDAQFRVDRLVGEGGFSAVYRGHHLGLEEPIAIKCLKLPPTLSPALVDTFVKRFRDESRILYRLSQGNLNIVRSIAAGTWQAASGLLVPYMVLEWLEGRSLANELTIRRTVGQQGRSLAEVLNVFAPAADGLGYAHSQGVVHRDLNPGNLFVTSARMKVLDFGVAKILDDAALNIGPRQMTIGQIRIFAPAYGAPEQFDDGIGPVGTASDVYSFALILMEALRDRCVNEGSHLGEFAQRAVSAQYRPTPRALGLQVPDEVEQIFARATRLDPRERFQSAGELWQALTMATKAASQERHAQAAMETPALGMPNAAQRSTQKGMGVPDSEDTRIGVLGGPRMDRTLPIGAVMPAFARPGARPGVPVDALPAGPARSPSSPGVARATARFGNENVEPSDAHPLAADEEIEDEVTRIREPDVDMLRGLAAADPRSLSTLSQGSPLGSPRPAAGAAPGPAAGFPPASPPFQAAQSQPEPHNGTQMMAPPGTATPPGGYAQTPHPQGQPQPQPQPHSMSAGAPPQQRGGLAGTMAMQQSPAMGMNMMPPQPQSAMQHAPSQPQSAMQHAPSQPQSAMQHAPSQPQNAMSAGQPFAQPSYAQTPPSQRESHPFGESLSLPGASPAAAAKGKKNTIVIVLVGCAVLLVLGAGGIGIALLKGKKDAAATTATSVPSASVAVLPVPTPTPTPTPTPAPTPTPTPTSEPVAEVADAGPTVEPTRTAVPVAATVPVTATTAAATYVPPVATVAKPIEPPPDPNAFNEPLARSRLAQANGVLVFCKKEGGVTGPGTASVTFANDGTVSEVRMQPPYAGTPAGDCVSGQYRRTKVNAYQGSPRTLVQQFEVPK